MIITDYIFQDLEDSIVAIVSKFDTQWPHGKARKATLSLCNCLPAFRSQLIKIVRPCNRKLLQKADKAMSSRLRLYREAFPALRSRLDNIVETLHEKKLQECHELRIVKHNDDHAPDFADFLVACRSKIVADHLLKTASEL